MLLLQLTLPQVVQISTALLPEGYRVRAQYSIQTDDVYVRVEHPDHTRHVNLEPISAGQLYATAEEFGEAVRAALLTARDLLEQPQVQANADATAS